MVTPSRSPGSWIFRLPAGTSSPDLAKAQARPGRSPGPTRVACDRGCEPQFYLRPIEGPVQSRRPTSPGMGTGQDPLAAGSAGRKPGRDAHSEGRTPRNPWVHPTTSTVCGIDPPAHRSPRRLGRNCPGLLWVIAGYAAKHPIRLPLDSAGRLCPGSVPATSRLQRPFCATLDSSGGTKMRTPAQVA